MNPHQCIRSITLVDNIHVYLVKSLSSSSYIKIPLCSYISILLKIYTKTLLNLVLNSMYVRTYVSK